MNSIARKVFAAMILSFLATASLALYSALAVAYVYRWRGVTRYATFAQYIRKSWPVFAPLNCVLYMTTRGWARKPVLAAACVPNLSVLRDNWEVIREEALVLRSTGAFDAATAAGSAGYYDVGFRSFFKRGWSKFYLKWYGTTHLSAQLACPKTVALLDRVPEVQGAMFSILPAGAELSLHSDPMACSLRYHLGLETPNSERCGIEVDGIPCTWHDGQDFIFDETYPHQARNSTEGARLILMCDVARPLNAFGRAFNAAYRVLAGCAVVPNTRDDRRGMISALFATIEPLRERGARLKRAHRGRYKAVQYPAIAALLAVPLAAAYAVLRWIEVALLAFFLR